MRHVLHLGSYAQGVNDIVYLMQRALAPLCELKALDLRLYRRVLRLRIPSAWVDCDEGRHWLRREKIEPVLRDFRPDVVVCNAGGISFRPDYHEELRRRGLLRVGIALSDPDVFPRHGQVFAKHFDLFYTNARSSLADYQAIGVEARLLPFAGLPEFHRPMPEVPKRFDVVVVGAARPERRAFVEHLREKGISVGAFGAGWSRSPFARRRAVHGEAHVRAINSGRMYLSFSATQAGHRNVKVGVFEAAACGACILTERFEEMESYFEYGREILGYATFDEALEWIRRCLGDEPFRRSIAERCRARLSAEHTWRHRWEGVLRDVEWRRLSRL
ncbi:MAG: glycosyltransferase [Candidatus Sumerlaeota bacterium]|nr:glycosyltransferase [Candidatus Sumerlaeota bacterium]